MHDDDSPDESARPRDARVRLVAIILVAAMVLTLAPVLISLFT